MSLALPPPSSPLWDLFNVADLVEFRSLPMLRDCIISLRNTVKGDGVHSAQGLALTAMGEVVLIKCGPRGGIKTLWNFGDPWKTGK